MDDVERRPGIGEPQLPVDEHPLLAGQHTRVSVDIGHCIYPYWRGNLSLEIREHDSRMRGAAWLWPKGYVILTEEIKDPEGMKAYGQAAGAAMGGVKVLAVDAKPQVLEGNWHGHQTVVLEFESVEAAQAWYDSEAYRAARELRQAAADTNAVILSGF